jgi:deoxyribodipyrimidine photolyase
MASTALVWFRRDLRVHDHPPLRAALDACERVVPVFVLDDRLLHGRHASGSRTRFVPELEDVGLVQLATPWEAGHPAPIVDHAVERRRTLAAYAAARGS